MSEKVPKVLLTCSAGGHLLQMYRLLKPVFSQYDRMWVALAASDSKSLLAGERVIWAYGPTNRNLVNLVRNFYLSWGVLRRERPTCIISTGAAVAIPLMVLGRLMGIRTVYIESFARQSGLSFTGWILYPIVHDFIVQNDNLCKVYPRALFLGTVY